ncbi:hypothetical protein [Nocardioides daphniae]|uniref:Uncharacterized protein n=1 Tax=Nocardioides daphniae TaxID=402297 RepID=A0A4P7UBX9_9ACTN|nr:hypothetical protein [Nocardioides daphniae]QCC76825.1 hypothetical protein E2C04_05630 [Nocardioides daphniae]GGD16881.1 hypothetical protein GCM10007231_14810 [Nocardioides daphniae]
MITRRAAAQRLDIPVEMATRNGLPSKLTEAQLRQIEDNPPPWLVQSRANRTGKKPVWVDLECSVCGFAEKARPKKWWPAFTHLACEHHRASGLPPVPAGEQRAEYPGIGSRFVGFVDFPLDL